MSPIEFHGKCCLLISCNHKFIIFMFNDSLYVKYVPNLFTYYCFFVNSQTSSVPEAFSMLADHRCQLYYFYCVTLLLA